MFQFEIRIALFKISLTTVIVIDPSLNLFYLQCICMYSVSYDFSCTDTTNNMRKISPIVLTNFSSFDQLLQDFIFLKEKQFLFISCAPMKFKVWRFLRMMSQHTLSVSDWIYGIQQHTICPIIYCSLLGNSAFSDIPKYIIKESSTLFHLFFISVGQININTLLFRFRFQVIEYLSNTIFLILIFTILDKFYRFMQTLMIFILIMRIYTQLLLLRKIIST